MPGPNQIQRFRSRLATLALCLLATFSNPAALAGDPQALESDPAVSQEAPKEDAGGEISLADTFLDLENKAGLVGNTSDSYSKRLQGLELKVFGEVKDDCALVQRVERLKKELETRTTDKEEAAPESKPVSPIQHHIENLVRNLPPGNTTMPFFLRVEPAKELEEADYLAEILEATQKKVLRFKSMPIPVYITPYKVRSYNRACIEGFESWEQRTDGKVRFVQVDNPNLARIKVVWKRLGMSTDTENCALGAHTVTKWTKHPSGKMTVVAVGSIPLPMYIPRLGPKYSVPAQIIEVNLDLIDAKTQDFRFILLKNIVTHELGHALGLLGHSLEKSDMMYSVTDENSRISKRDITTLTKLYELKVDIPL